MERKTCEFCGTEYEAELEQCPLCGKSSHPAAEAKQKRRLASTGGGARVASKKGTKEQPQTGSSRLVWSIVCVVLGAAVLAGAAYFVHIMGYLRGDLDAYPPFLWK